MSMSQPLLWALLIVVMTACTPATDHTRMSETTPGPSDTADRLDRYLAARVAQGFAGVVLVETTDGTVLHRPYALTDPPPGQAHCFWLASISKMFTAAAAVSLAEQGRLDLHAPIGDILDSVPDDKQRITMHHLLTHTSGLPDSYVAEGITDATRAIDAILATRLAHPVGAQYLYSANGYSLAALVIEHVSGRPFEEAVQTHAFAPAGMRDSGFWGHPVESCALAPYATRQRISDAMRVPNYGFRGPTGLRSTAADLQRWYRALTGDRLLGAAWRDRLFTPHVTKTPQVSYGYGWNIVRTDRGTRMWAHTGQDDLLSHVSYLYAFPDEGVLVILLANAELAVANETLRGLLRMLFPDNAAP